MPSVIYNSFMDDLAKGNIVPNTDTFYLMLVTSSYTPDKDAHTKRSSITNEVSGTGYTAGGAQTTCTVSLDTTNDRTVLTFGNVSWSNSTITARGGVIYKRRGGSASADELVAYVDFGSNITSTNGTFLVTFTTPLYINNPS